MSITPNAMPKKSNPVHQSLLAGLIETKPVTSKYKTIKVEDGKEIVTERVVIRPGLRFPLAQNVSSENVDRLAERWIA